MKQVLSIEQTKHLRELGIVMNDTILCWCENLQNGTQELQINNSAVYSRSWIKTTPTFTLDEVLELLPNKVDDELILFIDKGKYKWRIGYTDISTDEIFEDFRSENFIDAAYEMLCWVIENGYLKVE